MVIHIMTSIINKRQIITKNIHCPFKKINANLNKESFTN